MAKKKRRARRSSNGVTAVAVKRRGRPKKSATRKGVPKPVAPPQNGQGDTILLGAIRQLEEMVSGRAGTVHTGLPPVADELWNRLRDKRRQGADHVSKYTARADAGPQQGQTEYGFLIDLCPEGDHVATIRLAVCRRPGTDDEFVQVQLTSPKASAYIEVEMAETALQAVTLMQSMYRQAS